MKNLFTLFCLALITSTCFSQDIANFNDFDEVQLSHTDSIPDFQNKEAQLKLTGTIYQSDGITPAKDVILYIEQRDENGRYKLVKEDNKRFVYHRGWIKTDANGQYTFYTFMPGSIHRSNNYKYITPVVKAPGQDEYELSAFIFDNDPILSKHCRKRLAKKGKADAILKVVTSENNLMVVTRDITLTDNVLENK